jgi:hypothetical protein
VGDKSSFVPTLKKCNNLNVFENVDICKTYPWECRNDRHGAAAARGAHNSEVTGSKPVAGIFFPVIRLKFLNFG